MAGNDMTGSDMEATMVGGCSIADPGSMVEGMSRCAVRASQAIGGRSLSPAAVTLS